MFCMKCGAELPDDAQSCPNCGTVINTVFMKDCGAVVTTVFIKDSKGGIPSHTEKKAPLCVESVVGFTLACIGFVVNLIGIPGIIATIVSVVGLINCYNKKLRGTVFAVLGIIIGLISIYFGIRIFLSGASTFLNEFFGWTP